MTPNQSPSRTMPDQPAANSGAAVGFIVGVLLGFAVIVAVASQPWLHAYATPIHAYATPIQVIVGSCVGGTLCGAIVGWLRDKAAQNS